MNGLNLKVAFFLAVCFPLIGHAQLGPVELMPADVFAALAATTVGALLVPSVGLGETEDAAEVALALEAAERCFERLVGANGDLDQGIWAAVRRRGARGC